MHVFVTGATGWVGSIVVKELLEHSHRVTGLARNAEKAKSLMATGAGVLTGTLDDLDLLKATAGQCDAVIHTAFNHDFSKFAENAQQDARAIEALGSALVGSDRPLIVTSGTALVSPGRIAVETDVVPSNSPHPRKSETAAAALAERGVRVASVRLPPTVHGVGDHGFIPILINLAREKRVSAYIGDGANRWPAVHRLDAGRVYRLILHHGATQSVYHAVAEEGIAFKQIAEVIGRQLDLPVEPRPRDHFGWFATFAGGDYPTSSVLTRKWLNWTPTMPGLLEDLDQPAYFEN